MREYLFRGIREDNGEWVEGSLLRNEERCIIVQTNTDFSSDYYHDLTCSLFFDVKSETVGQYTGFNDRSGNAIYEGDIVKEELGNGRIERYITYNWFGCWSIKNVANEEDNDYLWNYRQVITVIGNCYSNPELLKKD